VDAKRSDPGESGGRGYPEAPDGSLDGVRSRRMGGGALHGLEARIPEVAPIGIFLCESTF